MRKILKLFPILILMFSCENKDLVIQKSKTNCDCTKKIQLAYIFTNYEHEDWCYRMLSDCESILFQSYEKIEKILSKTNSIELFNQSKTKVYKVLLQVNDKNIISYVEYSIQPTQTIQLGCNSNFNVDINTYHNISVNGDCFDAISLSNLSKIKIEYKIHKIKLISEY